MQMFFLCKDSNYASMVGCSNLKLYDHQLLPAKYLLKQKLNNGTRHSKKIMLYFEMGSGKSATLAESIALLSSHLRLALIVVPPAVVSSMINELKSCPMTQLKTETPMKAIFKIQDTLVYLISYASITKDHFKIWKKKNKIGQNCLVCFDESQAFLRKSNAKIDSAIEEAHYLTQECEFVILMTGTPMHTRVSDLYSQLHLISAPKMHNLDEADARRWALSVSSKADANKYFSKFKNPEASKIFFYKNAENAAAFPKIHEYEIWVKTTKEMDVLWSVVSAVESDWNKHQKKLSDKDYKFVQQIRDFLIKTKGQKKATSKEHKEISSNMTFERKSTKITKSHLKPSPKLVKMVEFIKKRRDLLPAIVLTESRKPLYGGGEKVAEMLQREASTQKVNAATSGSRKVYTCKFCGQPKKGHICPKATKAIKGGDLQPLRVMTMFGGQDHADVFEAYKNGKVDVIVCTIVEGYNLNCKLAGTMKYAPHCRPVRSVHFSHPPESFGQKLQFQARGRRLWSHEKLPLKERIIRVFTWVSGPTPVVYTNKQPTDNVSLKGFEETVSYDSHILHKTKSEYKRIQIVEGAIENVLGGVNYLKLPPAPTSTPIKKVRFSLNDDDDVDSDDEDEEEYVDSDDEDSDDDSDDGDY